MSQTGTISRGAVLPVERINLFSSVQVKDPNNPFQQLTEEIKTVSVIMIFFGQRNFLYMFHLIPIAYDLSNVQILFLVGS